MKKIRDRVLNIDLQQIIHSGLLPPHFLSPDPIQDLRSYVAIEIKGAKRVHSGHTRGLKALLAEYTVDKTIIVSMEKV